jgi:hypothetical protein
MTPKKFVIFHFLQWLIFAALKVWFFQTIIFFNSGIQEIVFWVILGIIAVAFVRRFGPISYLEAFYAMVTWVVIDLILDLIFTSKYTGLSLFTSSSYWWSFVVLAASILLFHKKRHVHIRHEMHAQKHAKH